MKEPLTKNNTYLKRMTNLGGGIYFIELVGSTHINLSVLFASGTEKKRRRFKMSSESLDFDLKINFESKKKIYLAVSGFHDSVFDFTSVNLKNMKVLHSIERFNDQSYKIELISEAGEIIETLCRVTIQDGIKAFDFISKAFNKEIWLGNVSTKPICRAIGLFHEAAIVLSKSTTDKS